MLMTAYLRHSIGTIFLELRWDDGSTVDEKLLKQNLFEVMPPTLGVPSMCARRILDQFGGAMANGGMTGSRMVDTATLVASARKIITSLAEAMRVEIPLSIDEILLTQARVQLQFEMP